MKPYIQSLGIVSGDELARIDNLIHQKTVCKGEVLLHENEICRYLYFVNSGALRSYYFNYDGGEITDCIAFPGEFMSSFSSFICHQPSHKTIQALLDTEYLFISYDNLEALYDSSINWQKAGRRHYIASYLGISARHLTHIRKSLL